MYGGIQEKQDRQACEWPDPFLVVLFIRGDLVPPFHDITCVAALFARTRESVKVLSAVIADVVVVYSFGNFGGPMVSADMMHNFMECSQ